MANVLALHSDNTVTLTGLHYVDSAGATVYVDNATVAVQAYLATDLTTTVGSPLTLAYVVASNGEYVGTYPYTTAFAVDVNYALVWTAVASSGNREGTDIVPCLRVS